ncbi:AMP-binding enzyme family protein, partial [Vibrio parahaemolyticus EKP-008]
SLCGLLACGPTLSRRQLRFCSSSSLDHGAGVCGWSGVDFSSNRQLC